MFRFDWRWGGHWFCPRPFRFEFVWLAAEGFQDLIRGWWREMTPTGCGAFVLAKKLACLKVKLRSWAKFNFGSVKLKKLAFLQEVERLDIIKESRCLDTSEIDLERQLLQSLENVHKQEEIYWKQRSRIQWLKEGDGNTRFFHAVSNGRKSINLIPEITYDGAEVTNPREIGKVFVSRFQQQFGSKRSSRFKVDLLKLLSNKRQVNLTELERPYAREEIKNAMFSLGGNKAPGPDDFPMHFFKLFWETIKVQGGHLQVL